MMAKTDQAYVFVNDSPLNLNDPLGLYASSGNGQSAFVSATTNDGSKKTVIVVSSSLGAVTTAITSGPKNVTLSISTTPITFPVGLGTNVTVSASATVSQPVNKGLPTIGFQGNGSVDISQNGMTGSINPTNMDIFGASTFTIPDATTSKSFNLGGDVVTLSVSASIEGGTTPVGWLTTWDQLVQYGEVLAAVPSNAVLACAADPVFCGAGALA